MTAAALHDLPSLVVGDLVLQVEPPSDRKTIEIVVERDASLLLKAPPTATVERATQFVAAKRSWVYRKLAEKDALTGPAVVKQFVEGEGFAYLGRSYRLTLTTEMRRPRRRPRPSRPWPIPPERSRSRQRRCRNAPLVHRCRRPVAPPKDPPLGCPHGRRRGKRRGP